MSKAHIPQTSGNIKQKETDSSLHNTISHHKHLYENSKPLRKTGAEKSVTKTFVGERERERERNAQT